MGNLALFAMVEMVCTSATKRFSNDILSYFSSSYVVVSTALQGCEADSAQVKESPEKKETCRKKKQYHRQNRAARDLGVAQSLEDRDSGFSLTDGYCAALPSATLVFFLYNYCWLL